MEQQGSERQSGDEASVSSVKYSPCPYCGTPMEQDPFDVKLSPRRMAIFRMVANAGPDGISEHDLDRGVSTGKGKSTVRSAIHYINKAITPLKINGKKGVGYRLVREIKHSGKEQRHG